MCIFVFAYADCWFADAAANILLLAVLRFLFISFDLLPQPTVMVIPGRWLHFIGLLPQILMSWLAKCSLKYGHCWFADAAASILLLTVLRFLFISFDLLPQPTVMVIPGRWLHFIGLLTQILMSWLAKCSLKYGHVGIWDPPIGT